MEGQSSLSYILAPVSCFQAAPGMHAQLPAMGLEGAAGVVASELKAEVDWKEPLVTTGVSLGSCKASIDLRVPK